MIHGGSYGGGKQVETSSYSGTIHHVAPAKSYGGKNLRIVRFTKLILFCYNLEYYFRFS